MSFGGFTAAAAKVVLGVDTTAFNAGLHAAETQFARSAGSIGGIQAEMSERSIRAAVAEERLARSIQKFGPASVEARAAMASMVGETRKLVDIQNAGVGSTGRFIRGLEAGASRGIGFGRAMAFASNAFLGGAGFIYAVHSAVSAASTFRGEMRLLQTQALATNKEVVQMREKVLRISPSLATGPNELAKGLYRVESAGIRGARAIQILTTATKGARIGHSDIEATTNALVASTKSRIEGAQNLSQAMSTLDAIVGTGNMRMEDLTQALTSGILPASRQFKLSLADLGGALATLTVQGQPAELSATRLRYTIALLGAQTPKAEKELKTIGLTTGQLGQAMEDAAKKHSPALVAALELLDKKLKASNLSAEAQRTLLVRAFGGGRSFTTLQALLQNLDMVKKKTREINEQGTPAHFEQRWKAQVATYEFAFDKLKAVADVVKVRIGNALLPDARKSTTAIAAWLEKAENQKRLARDMGDALHYAEKGAHEFGHALGQMHDLLKVTDALLGGTGHSLKVLAEYMVLKKMLGFARGWNNAILEPIRQTTATVFGAKTALGELDAAVGESNMALGESNIIASGGAPMGQFRGVAPWRMQEAMAADSVGQFLVGMSKEATTATRVTKTAADVQTAALDKVTVAKQTARAVHPDKTDIDVLQLQTNAIGEQTAALSNLAAAKVTAFEGVRGVQPGAGSLFQAAAGATVGQSAMSVSALIAGGMSYRQAAAAMQQLRQRGIVGSGGEVAATHPDYLMAQRYAVGGGRLAPDALAQALNIAPAEASAVMAQMYQRGVLTRNPSYGQSKPKYTTSDVIEHFGAGNLTRAQAQSIAAKANALYPGAAEAPFQLAEGAPAAAIPPGFFIDRAARGSGISPQVLAAAKRDQARRMAPRWRTLRAGRFSSGIEVPDQQPTATVAPTSAVPPSEFQANWRYSAAQLAAMRALNDADKQGAITTKSKVEADELATKATEARAKATSSAAVAANAQVAADEKAARAARATRAVQHSKALDIIQASTLTPANALREKAALKKLGLGSAAEADALRKELYASGKMTQFGQVFPRPTTRSLQGSAATYTTQASQAQAVADERAKVAANELKTADNITAAAAEKRTIAEKDLQAAIEARTKAQAEAAASAQKATTAAATAANAPAAAAVQAQRESKAAAEQLQRANFQQMVGTEKVVRALAAEGRTLAEVDSMTNKLTADEARRLKIQQEAQQLGYGGGLRPVAGAVYDEETGRYVKPPSRFQRAAGRARGFGSGLNGYFAGDNGMNRSLTFGMMAALLGNQLPGALGMHGAAANGLGSMITGAGTGMMFASMLRINPLLGATVGAGAGVKHLVPGKGGSMLGNVLEGAGAGAIAASVIPIPGVSQVGGALIGGGVALGASLFKLMHHSNSTADAISRLGTAAALSGGKVKQYKEALFQLGVERPNAVVAVDEAKKALDAAKAEEIATRGTKNHLEAMHRLAAAYANYRAAAHQLALINEAARKTHDDLAASQKTNRVQTEQLKQKFIDIGSAAKKHRLSIIDIRQGYDQTQASVHEYVQKMRDMSEKLKDSNPKLSLAAAELAQIAQNANKIPPIKTVNVIVKVGFDQQSFQTARTQANELQSMIGGGNGSVFGVNLGPPTPKQYVFRHGEWETKAGQRVNQTVANRLWHKNHVGDPHERSVVQVPTSVGQSVPTMQGSKVRWSGATAGLDRGFMTKVENAVAAAGGTAIIVSSGKRSDATHPGGPANHGASNSNHLYGHAIDGEFVINGRKFPAGDAPVNYSAWGLRPGREFDWNGSPDRYHVDDDYNHGGRSSSGGSTKTTPKAPPFNAEIPQSLVTAELKAEATGNKGAERKALLAEKAYLQKQLPRAKNDAQRAQIYQQIISINSQLASLKSGGTGTGVSGLVPPALDDAYQSAVQSGDKNAQLKALQAEAAFLRKYVAAHKTGKLHTRGEAALTTVMRRIHALQKAGATGSDILPNDLEIAYQKALRTPGKADDIKALTAEQKFLQKWLKDHPGDGKKQLEANKLLTSIDKKLDKLIKTNQDILRAQEKKFLDELASFWSQFGSNVFTEHGGKFFPGANNPGMGAGATHPGHGTTGPKGKGKGKHGGGGAHADVAHVTVEQHFPHPPTKDGHREARMAMHAVRSALDG